MPWAGVLLLAVLAGCEAEQPQSRGSSVPSSGGFVDITTAAGIDFEQDFGAQGLFYFPEIVAGGGGFFDYDGDGDADLFLVNGASIPPASTGPRHALYRNRGDGTFEEVSAAAGVDRVHPGMGAVAGDIDNDGDQDLFVSGVDRNLLFVNQGDGTFVERGEEAGVQTHGWATACSFLDYNRDGALDLLVGHYVKWSPALEQQATTERKCEYEVGVRDYCPVWVFDPDRLFLFRGRGDGSFEDVTDPAGLTADSSKVLGLAVLDFDADGWLDVYVANDKVAGQLYHNQGDGTFLEIGYEVGLALDQWGNSYAGMGVDVAHLSGDDAVAISVGNFSGEPVTLHRQQRAVDGSVLCDQFQEVSRDLGVGGPTMRVVTFGLFFFDYDLDAQEDLLVVNGHVGEVQVREGIPLRQPCQLFRRTGDQFVPALLADDDPLRIPVVGRGAAYADVDGDGDLDVLVVENQGRARLLENQAARGNYLRVTLAGKASNRDGIGARVTLKLGELQLRDRLVTGTSFLSMHELPLTFGLAAARSVDQVEVVWPSGVRDLYRQVAANSTLHCEEGETDSGRSQEEMAKAAITSYVNRSFPELLQFAQEHPDDGPLQKLVGAEALETEQWELAETHLARAVELVPLDHVAAVHYLRALYHRGKKAAVQEQLERMFDTFEEVVLSLNALLYLGNLGESELGLQLIAEGLRRNPRSASYHQSAGNIHKAMEAWSPALVCYQAAIDCDRQHVNAYLGKARCHLVLDQLAEAEATLRELLQVVADSKEGGRLLAQTLVLGKRPHEAAQIYSRLRQVDPNDFELALAHSRLLPNKEREALLSQVTKKHPQRAEAWQEYLRLLLQMGRQKKIMTAVEAALLHCGEEPAILYLSAFAVQTVRKDSAGALPLLRKALGLFPGHVEAWRLRGRLAQQEGLVEEARECWQKILELRPKDREAHKKLGQEDSDSAQE